MKLTKERVIILILSVLLLATAIAAVCFCHHVSSVYHAEKAEWEATEADIREATKSEEVFRDGLWVEATVYLTDFELDKENGRLNFVIMLMYGREAQSKTKTASPATIPKSGERNRKIHSCMLYLISI